MRVDESIEFTADDIKEALKRPSNFAMFDEEGKMFVTWSLGPVIEHRDSDALDRSNAEALKRYLAIIPELEDDWEINSCNHWAVGWVNHISYRVVNADGSPARIARILKSWFDYLKNQHPVADEDLFSEFEQEDADLTWKNCYSPEDRIEYIREHRNQFEFHSFADLLGCVRGKYFAGYASELLS